MFIVLKFFGPITFIGFISAPKSKNSTYLIPEEATFNFDSDRAKTHSEWY